MGRHFEVRAKAMEATAKKKSAIYMRASKEIYIAAKQGTPDPDSNLALRSAIDKYKSQGVPKDVIERAIKKAESMPLAKARELFTNLRKGRAFRKEVLDTLQVEYHDVDVNILALDELETTLSNRLNAYIEESLRTAKNNLSHADYATRQQMYDNLINGGRRQKKEVLTQLGVDVAAEVVYHDAHLVSGDAQRELQQDREHSGRQAVRHGQRLGGSLGAYPGL